MQKINCILKILFNSDELTLQAKTSTHYIQSKHNGALEFALRLRYLHCVHT